jgi:hypothetical protein
MSACTQTKDPSERDQREQVLAQSHDSQHDHLGLRNGRNTRRKRHDLLNRSQGKGEILTRNRKADESHFVTRCCRTSVGLRHFRDTPGLHTASGVAKVAGQQRIEINQTGRCAIIVGCTGAPERCHPVDYEADRSTLIDNDNTGIRNRAFPASDKAME